jgi:hypothetical protein
MMSSRYALFAALCVGVFGSPAAAGNSGAIPDFTVTEAAKRLLPLAKNHAVGEEFTLKEYEPALIGGIALRDVTAIDHPMTITVGGIGWSLGPDDLLAEMQGFSGGDSASLPPGSVAYCRLKPIRPRNPDGPVRSDEKQLRNYRFEKESSLCLVDAGGDGTFDQAFMTGLKQPEDRHLVAIEKTPYKAVGDMPVPNSIVAIVFHHQNFMHTPRFYAQVFLLGKEVPLVSMELPATTSAGAPLQGVGISQNTPKDQLPLTLSFGPGRFTVLSIDSNTKTARVRKDADWGDAPVKITQTVYR